MGKLDFCDGAGVISLLAWVIFPSELLAPSQKFNKKQPIKSGLFVGFAP